MQIKELSWYSDRLYRDMPLKIYGHAGKPCLVIPSQNGKRNDFEGFGMVEVCRPWIEAGKLQLFCVDTIDEETVSCAWKNPRERIEQHERWMQYLMQEVYPLMVQYGCVTKAPIPLKKAFRPIPREIICRNGAVIHS